MKTPQFSRSTAGRDTQPVLTGSRLPFGYHLECDADLLIVRRSDGSFVAAFNAGNVDPFEVEWPVWEDEPYEGKKDHLPYRTTNRSARSEQHQVSCQYGGKESGALGVLTGKRERS